MEVVMAGTAAVAAARAAKVFWLRLPNGRPRLRDTGGVTTGLVTFFPLPFGRPGLHFSRAPSPPAPRPPREDMVRLRSNGRSEAEEVVECVLDPECPRHLKRRNAGKGAGIMGSAMPNALVTAPLSSHRAHPREGNRRGHRSGSWVEPTGRDADARRATPRDVSRSYYGDRKVQATGRYAAVSRPVAAWVQDPKRFKFRRAGRRLAAAEQPKAGPVLEPARPETAGSTPRDLAIRATTSKPDEESWDFDGRESTSARNRTRQSPMLTHEISPVSEASVVGMTIRVGQGQNHLPVDVPGISTALGQKGRLRPRGRLRQQPAGDSASGGSSRRRRRNPSNGCFTKSSLAPTRSTEAGDKHDTSHARPLPINGQEPSPRKDPRQSKGHMPRRCRSKGKRHFIKLPSSDKGVRGLRAHAKTVATEESAAGQPGT
jgi:hypothetical protein